MSFPFGLALLVAAADPGCGCAAAVTPETLLRMSRDELLALYAAAAPGPAPAGFLPGTAILDPGGRGTVRKAKVIGLGWHGKEFPGDGTMVNRLPLGLRAVRARAFLGDGWYDGRPAWVFDYAGTSRLFGHVRDEVREVSPGVYLGLTYLRRPDGARLAMFFALDARP